MAQLIYYNSVGISSWWRDQYWVDPFVRHPDWFVFSERNVQAFSIGWEKPCETHMCFNSECAICKARRDICQEKITIIWKLSVLAVIACHCEEQQEALFFFNMIGVVALVSRRVGTSVVTDTGYKEDLFLLVDDGLIEFFVCVLLFT